MIQTLIGAVVLAAVSLFSGSIIGNLKVGPSDVDLSSKLAHVLPARACVAETLALDNQVRGLKVAFPALPGTKMRQTFEGNGLYVTYKVAATPQTVADFYSQESSKYCLKQVQGDGLVFNDGGNLAVRVTPVSTEEKSTLVAYEVGTVLGQKKVLGISARRGTLLAQTEGGSYTPPPSGDSGLYSPPPPGDSGSYSPPPSGGTYTPPPSGDAGTYVPPSGGTYQPPSGTYTPPPGDQYQPPSGPVYPTGQYPSTGQYQPSPYPGPQPYPSGQPYPSNTNMPYPSQPYPSNQPGGMYPNQQPSQGQFTPMQPGPTCRVNGVEMPGPCTNYQGSESGQYQQGYNQGMPGDMGGKYGGPQGPGMQYGPGQQEWGEGRQSPDEDRQRFEEQMREKMNAERLQQIKRGVNDFSRGISQMKKGIGFVEKKLKKCGVSLPIELKNALQAADGIIEKIKSVEDPEEFDPTDMEDVGSVMQEWGPRMGDLTRICDMLKNAERELKNLERTVVRYEQRAKANKKVDVTELIASMKEEVNKLKEVMAKVKEQVGLEPDVALELLEDEFFGQVDNVRMTQGAIDMAFNISQGLKEARREINNFEKQINALKRRKVDVSEALALLGTLKSQVEELRKLVSTKNFDPEELIEKVEAAFESREQLSDLIQKLGGANQYFPNIKGDSRYNVNFQLPQGFERSGGPSMNGGEGLGAPNESFGPSF